MSAAQATAPIPPAAGGRKKLIVMMIAALVLVFVAGVAVLLLLMRGPSLDDELLGPDAQPRAATAATVAPPPAYLPLDNFVVNLADRNAERYAQVGITLQVADTKASDALKGYMPAVRNAVLMILSHKTSEDLLSREGKEALASEIAMAAAGAMGLDLKSNPRVVNPVQQVHFSSFIIQ